MSIIGHNRIISFFDKLISENTLSQSYCFVGREKVGKRTVARHLAANLLKIDDQKLDSHPDFYYLSRQVDEKTNKLKKEISIAQARQIKERLGGKSWFGGYQVIIIDEAELLNEESGNALLKTLEEAGERRVFFLVTSNDSALLPTIRSRCQMIFFPLISSSEIEQGLMSLGYSGALVKEAAELAWGKPGRAIEICQNPEVKNNFSIEIDRWQRIITLPFYKRLQEVDDLLAEPKQANEITRTAEKLQEVLENWSVIWRNIILDKIFNKENKIISDIQMSLTQAVNILESFKKSQKILAQNVNPKLVIEQILLSLD